MWKEITTPHLHDKHCNREETTHYLHDEAVGREKIVTIMGYP
jgi:hypothetical protein